VLSDGLAGSTDEGRAMLENIHDIAPGAGLAFATANGGDLAMANNIRALATQAKAKLIVDDVSYPTEPFFQDGLISQAINDVTAMGVTYFSAAANQGNGGYLSAFRGVSGTVTGIGGGTFMNFDPTGGTLLQLPVTVTNDGPDVRLTFQFDQPFTTQQPAGSTAAVTSSLSIFAINTATGAIAASGVANNVATQTPFQFFTLAPGLYTIVIQLVSGPAPGHVEFANTGGSPNLHVPQTFGAPGTFGIYYPTSVGHETAANTIGVGAVPWWAPAPYLGTNPLANELNSSPGPGLYTLNPAGTPFTATIFTLFDRWARAPADGSDRSAARQAIVRGQKLFNTLPITISGVAGLNDVPLPLTSVTHPSRSAALSSRATVST
jgi:hypothetical protein